MFIDNGPGGKYDPIDVALPKFKQVFTDWDEKLKGKGWGSIFLPPALKFHLNDFFKNCFTKHFCIVIISQ